MKTISLLISPEVKGAFFKEYIECALAELKFCFPNSTAEYAPIGTLDFVKVEIDEGALERLPRLSFFQGAFDLEDNKLIPLDLTPNFKLHDNFIFGSKFKGKTNERFTQMMLNVGLASILKREKVKILDPMCGRATTLLWSLRYGFNAKGIELDPKAGPDIKQIVKKWSKVCSVSTKIKDGYISKKTKSNVGKFLEVTSGGNSLKVITGDSTDAANLLSKEKFDLIITDIPYGIQHHTNSGAKNPMTTLEKCLPEWIKCLSDSGSIVIGFNSNNPRRSKLEALADTHKLEVVNYTVPHRMSESIVRDVVILKKFL